MKVEKIPISELNILSKLMKDYILEKDEIKHLYKYKKNIESFKNVIKDKSKQAINREVLSEELFNQYAQIEDKDLVIENIKLLKDNKTFTITTAHQLCLFTGPLYFIYKIISTIKLCKILKENYPKCNFIPVYWMGSEDHDFDEINHLNISNKKIEWERSQFGAIGKMTNKNIDKSIKELSKYFFNSENNKIIKKLNLFFDSNNTYGNSYIKYIHFLFKDFGLVILEQDNINFKKIFSKVLNDELINNIITKTTIKEIKYISDNYKIQANPRSVNIFYMIDGLRERIIKKEDYFFVNNTDISFSQKELISELNLHPERFSPNVLLRPLFQESILPNLAYIGGGGELAYWLQLRSLFDSQEINFPMLLLRDTGLIINKDNNKFIEKYSIDKKSLFLNKELLISNLIKVNSSNTLDLTQEKLLINNNFDMILKIALKIDLSLERNILSEKKKALNSIDKIELKMLRSEKRKNDVLVKQISFLKEELFPNNKLQERNDNFLPYFDKFGFDFFNLLIDEFNPLLSEFKIFSEEK